ncbi:MAG: hypothetical protein JO166_08005 [Deltaproteobacteria bacterium]|nr:hypothetical protein [Deltaproteobacteria bacterium]
MKKAVLMLSLLLPGGLLAQQNEAAPAGTIPNSVTFPTERVVTPTASDLYCAGFVGKPVENHDRFVAGGLESPSTSRFANGDAVFLNGKGYETGQEYTVVRELRDPNRYELFPGQWAALKAAGQPYAELARIQIVDTRNKMAIARVEFSCDGIVAGDYVIPFVEKPANAFHPPLRFDRFAPANGQTTGRILLAKDFDSELGNGGKVYINIGATQGVKVGDLLRVVRSYEATAHDAVESLSFKAATTEPTQTKQAAVDPTFLSKTGGPEVQIAQMPRRAVGTILIVGTTANTATGMIVFSEEPVHIGDRVEVDQQQ